MAPDLVLAVLFNVDERLPIDADQRRWDGQFRGPGGRHVSPTFADCSAGFADNRLCPLRR
ncbi:protein of unknown function [Pseudomonas sp. JV241A]|nr:protein of unknown function [Pseudomonas sp. JV241A]